MVNYKINLKNETVKIFGAATKFLMNVKQNLFNYKLFTSYDFITAWRENQATTMNFSSNLANL